MDEEKKCVYIDKRELLQKGEKKETDEEQSSPVEVASATIKQEEVVKKKAGGRPKKQIDVEKIIQLKKEGKPYLEIAKEVGVSTGLISKILKEYKELE